MREVYSEKWGTLKECFCAKIQTDVLTYMILNNDADDMADTMKKHGVKFTSSSQDMLYVIFVFDEETIRDKAIKEVNEQYGKPITSPYETQTAVTPEGFLLTDVPLFNS